MADQKKQSEKKDSNRQQQQQQQQPDRNKQMGEKPGSDKERQHGSESRKH